MNRLIRFQVIVIILTFKQLRVLKKLPQIQTEGQHPPNHLNSALSKTLYKSATLEELSFYVLKVSVVS